MAQKAQQMFEIQAEGGNSADFTLKVGNLQFSNLPTSDPGVAGQLYNDSGTVKVSAG